jgi:hypothetical protein
LNASSPRLAAVDAKILAGLLAIPLVMFGDAVLGRRIFYERDILAYWYPQVETVVRVVAQGAWPLWDPYEGFGRPLLARPDAQLLYPFTWFDLLLPPKIAYTVLVVAHTWLAAAGAYVLSRTWGASRRAAALAGIAMGGSGAFVSAASLFHHFVGAAWLPWILVAFESVLQQRTTRSAVILGFVAGVQILAGSGDMVVLAALAATLVFGETLLREGRRVLDRATLGRLALAAVLALGLSAGQWLPAVAVARTSARAHMPAEMNLYWSVHPASLVELLVPQALGPLPLSEPVRAALFESREPFLSSLYLGLSSALLLVPVARFSDPRRTILAIVAFAFFVLAALGRHAPVLPALLQLPVVSVFRYPVKYMIGAAVFWAILAGLGFQAWLRPWSDSERRTALRMAWVAAILAVCAICSGEALRLEAPRLGLWVNAPPDWRPLAYAPLVWKLRRAAALAAVCAVLLVLRGRAHPPRGATIAAALVVVVDVMAAARPVNDLAAPELAAYRPAALALMSGRPEDHRLFVPAAPMAVLNRSLVRGPAGWPPAWSWALGLQQMLQPPSGARWGLRGSYDADFTGMGSPAASNLAAMVAQYQGTALGLRLLRMGGVTDVASVLRDPVPGIVRVGEVGSVFTDPVRVGHVPGAVPRAYLVGRTRVARGDEAWRALADPEFDPATTVLLDGKDGLLPPADFRGAARVVEARSDRWRVSTEASAAGYLVVTEANAPGWQAEIDGRPVAVRTANMIFRAVAVPEGAHTVVMRYRPAPVAWGLGLSAVTAIAAGAMAARTWRRNA